MDVVGGIVQNIDNAQVEMENIVGENIINEQSNEANESRISN